VGIIYGDSSPFAYIEGDKDIFTSSQIRRDMESLESRMERLTPEQRREVEDFVDFLILKNNIRQTPSVSSPPSQVMMNAPPVLSAEPAYSPQTKPVLMQDSAIPEDAHPPMALDDPAPAPVHEIRAGDEDWITHDYMDYGKFEKVSSPATEAVKNVKRKIIARETEDKSRHLLDWVD
jgi:hypothetical protein